MSSSNTPICSIFASGTRFRKETLGDNICAKTFTNFRRRLLEHEEETGQDLLHEVSRITEATSKTNLRSMPVPSEWIRRLSRLTSSNSLESISSPKSFTNFLDDLPNEIVQELPAGLDEFADTENLELSYESGARWVDSTMETLIEHAAWLIDRFEDEQNYAELEFLLIFSKSSTNSATAFLNLKTMTVITMKTTMTTIPVTASHRDGNHSGHSHPAREKQATSRPVMSQSSPMRTTMSKIASG